MHPRTLKISCQTHTAGRLFGLRRQVFTSALQSEPVCVRADMFVSVSFDPCVIKDGSSREDLDVDDSIRAQV